MRYTAAVLLLVTGCASTETILSVAPPQSLEGVDYSKVMRLVGRWGIAHACPAGGSVYTAAHNVEPRVPSLPEFLGYAWEDRLGNRGFLESMEYNHVRDVIRARILTGTPLYYPLALEMPEAGDAVSWVEYGPEHGQAIRNAVVLREWAGLIEFDARPMPGASGGCLFNAEGKVLGVVVWAIGANGAAKAVVGPWGL